MRTITLELLRHGPAHNQLLSPLTPYLALCENHAAVTLHVPFEHNQFLYRLRALGYKLTDESRRFQLADTARVMADILGAIPGLTAESGKACECEPNALDGERLTHLRLIISASELALLPFELALSPAGFPGAGQQLLLQPDMPVCLTREIRRVPSEEFQWPKKPKILFVSAAPPEVGEIPLESHLLVLRRAIAPWVRSYDDEDDRRQKVGQHLVFLPNATIEEIEHKCATGEFTHVHILAHGVERRDNYDTRFCLALHNAADPNTADYVSGTRLAAALRAAHRPEVRTLSRPAVVTLVCCDGANHGSVAGAGASIAHAIHESGIPMVLAGQFPLTFEGSVRLTEVLYDGLLWGVDPRNLLYDARRRLYSQFPDHHDWASITAYVSLPADFDEQLPSVQIEQALESINAAMNHADEATRNLFDEIGTTRPPTTSGSGTQAGRDVHAKLRLLETARFKIRTAKAKLERLLKTLPQEGARINGLLASTNKREAELLHLSTLKDFSDVISKDRQDDDRHQSFDLLRRARDHYWNAFLLDRAKSWAVVQYLSLTLIMTQARKGPNDGTPLQTPWESATGQSDKPLSALWSLAHQLSFYDLRSAKGVELVWAYGNLIELYLMWTLLPEPRPNLNVADPGAEAKRLTAELIEISGREEFGLYSTRRQLFRYFNWFALVFDLKAISALASELFQIFPHDLEDRWR